MNDQPNIFCNCLFYSSNALARVMTRMADEAFAPSGLGGSHAFLLMAVNRQPGLQPSQLADIMQLTPSTITRLIEKMEGKGFVHRETEGKVTRVYPLQASLDLNGRLTDQWMSLYKKYVDVLGEEFSRNLTEKTYLASQKLK